MSENIQDLIKKLRIERTDEIDTKDAILPDDIKDNLDPGWYFWICYEEPYQDYWYGPYEAYPNAETAWRQHGFDPRWKSGLPPRYFSDYPPNLGWDPSCP